MRIWRDYYKVLTDTDLVVIYYDLLDEKWYLQQVYNLSSSESINFEITECKIKHGKNHRRRTHQH